MFFLVDCIAGEYVAQCHSSAGEDAAPAAAHCAGVQMAWVDSTGSMANEVPVFTGWAAKVVAAAAVGLAPKIATLAAFNAATPWTCSLDADALHESELDGTAHESALNGKSAGATAGADIGDGGCSMSRGFSQRSAVGSGEVPGPAWLGWGSSLVIGCMDGATRGAAVGT